MNLGNVIRERSVVGATGRRRSIRLGAVCVALIAAAALIAGCGGSGSSSTPTKSSTPKTTKSTPATTPAASSTPSASNSTKSSTPSFANTTNCEALGGAGTKFAQAMEAATTGKKLNYQAAVKAYQGLANAAPSAIRPDLEQLASAFTSFANALSKTGYTAGKVPSPSQLAGLESAAKSLESSKLAAAEKHLESWAAANCK